MAGRSDLRQPQVSLLVLAYNQTDVVAEAVSSALAQDYTNLEVLLSDDHSSDGTREQLQDLARSYRGDHLVRFNRNRVNLGIAGHIRAAAGLAGGELLVFAAGDDRSHRSRVSKLVDRWCRAGKPSSAVLYSDARYITSDGSVVTGSRPIARPPFSLERLASQTSGGPLGATCAITPNLIGWPQVIDEAVRHEDRVFPFRALLAGGEILLVDETLVDYRMDGGVSRRGFRDTREFLTTWAKDHYTRVIPDARQRLSDALLANAPAKIIDICRARLVEQEAKLDMADGRLVARKAFRAVKAGADAIPMLKYAMKFALLH